MEPFGNDLQTHIGESDSKSIKGKRVAEELIYSVKREGGVQPLNLPTEGQTSSRHGYNLEIYRIRRVDTIENTIPKPKIRKKNPTYCSLEPLVDFPEEDREETMKDIYKWKRNQQVSTEEPRFASFPYKCVYPGCTVRMPAERVSLQPDNIMVSYGVHNHGDIQASQGQLPVQIASQKPVSSRDLLQFPFISLSQNQQVASHYEVREDIMQRFKSHSVYRMKLDQYIEHLKPNYGIFLEHPSKIKYGVLEDNLAESAGTASICGVSSSQVGHGETHQAFYAVNNDYHPPLYSNSIHNPYQSQQLQQVSNAESHSIPFPVLCSSSEPSITLGIPCTDPVMAGGEINFHYNLMQKSHNAGYYSFKPLTYEQPSSSLMPGGGYINSGVIHEVEQLQWIHSSSVQLKGNLTEN